MIFEGKINLCPHMAFTAISKLHVVTHQYKWACLFFYYKVIE